MARTEVIALDREGHPVAPAEAWTVEIIEYDDAGEVIRRTYGGPGVEGELPIRP